MLDGVLIQERDAILVAHTRGFERLGHLARAFVRLLPGLHAIALDERYFARETFGMSAQDARDVGDDWLASTLYR